MRARMITAACLLVVGAVWIGQGLGLLRGSSFMVDEPFWAVAGTGFVIAGSIIGVTAWRGERRGA